MRGQLSLLLSAALLLGATATTGQTLSCSSVSPEVREYVKQRGACRDIKAAVPRPKAAPRADQKKSDAQTSARKLAVPQLVGRTYADAVRELSQFTVESVDSASGKPGGTVLVQEPAAGALVAPGSIISLQVSDGSQIKAASTATAAAPVTTTAAPVTAPAPDPASASPTASTPLPEAANSAESRGQSATSITSNGVVIFVIGVSLGLLFGALWMRQRLLHHVPSATVIGFAPTLSPPPQPQPVVQSWADTPPVIKQSPDPTPVAQDSLNQESVDRQSADQQSVDQPLVNEQSADQQQADQQPVNQQSIDAQAIEEHIAEIEAGSAPEVDVAPEVAFVAWLVPVETTIELLARTEAVASEQSSDHYA